MKTKKWLNRGGLVAMIVGAVLLAVGGGDMSSAMEAATLASTVAGSVLVLIREVMG